MWISFWQRIGLIANQISLTQCMCWENINTAFTFFKVGTTRIVNVSKMLNSRKVTTNIWNAIVIVSESMPCVLPDHCIVAKTNLCSLWSQVTDYSFAAIV